MKVQHFIDGTFCDAVSGRTFANLNPATGEKLSDVALGDSADIDRAALAAEKALKGPWGKLTTAERATMLERLAHLLAGHTEEFARWETLDTGKPISETRTGDIPRSVRNLQFFASLVRHEAHESFIGEDGSQHRVTRDPVGVVGLITPWNLPLYLETWKLAPALAMGNTVILKPAELTPTTAFRLGQLCNEAGIPPGVVNIVQGFGERSAGAALVEHPRVKAISFTGETTTGVAISKASAPHLKKLSFELGGKGASVIFADAKLDEAIPVACRAAFRNQGQICLAGSRLLVHASIKDEVVTRLQKEIAKICVGDPLKDDTTMGALISTEHRDRVLSFIEYARKERVGSILTGGEIPFPAGAFLAPTLIVDVPQKSRLIQEEIFGPVLTVQTFTDDDEAMELLNDTPYGLSCSLWGQDLAKLEHLAASAHFGLVWLNSWFLRDLHTAFGGMKRSGVGREGGRYSLEFFSEAKTIARPKVWS